MWKNVVERDGSQKKIWRMRIVCWLRNSTITSSEYIIFIAFTLQQWLHEGALILRLLLVFFSLIKITLKIKYLKYVIFYL